MLVFLGISAILLNDAACCVNRSPAAREITIRQPQVFFLKEGSSVSKLAGVGLVLAGIVLLRKGKSQRRLGELTIV
jgi:hypothetical protein